MPSTYGKLEFKLLTEQKAENWIWNLFLGDPRMVGSILGWRENNVNWLA